MRRLASTVVIPADGAGRFIGDEIEGVRALATAQWEGMIADDGLDR